MQFHEFFCMDFFKFSAPLCLRTYNSCLSYTEFYHPSVGLLVIWSINNVQDDSQPSEFQFHLERLILVHTWPQHYLTIHRCVFLFLLFGLHILLLMKNWQDHKEYNKHFWNKSQFSYFKSIVQLQWARKFKRVQAKKTREIE